MGKPCLVTRQGVYLQLKHTTLVLQEYNADASKRPGITGMH